MGGIDKGLISFQRRYLIEHVIERMTPQVSELLINANRHLEVYASFGYRIVQDQDDLFSGPLAGIERGLSVAKTDWVAFTPCDSPFLPLDLVARLMNSTEQDNSRCAYVTTAEGMQPVFCVIHKSLYKNLCHSLAAGNRKLISWLKEQPHSEVFFDHSEAFINLNTREELEHYNHD